MNYIVAVSGGVDSVVLLDMLSYTQHKLIVAHVDHGIRGEESEADARFVKELAKKYQLPCVSTELHLGPGTSEERARHARYEFLFNQAATHHAQVVTAHHQDDMIETIALNLKRGTGWRGLAVLGRTDISRPLLGLSKAQLYTYAVTHQLEWVEDATNRTDVYLRNRLRQRLAREQDNSLAPRLSALRSQQLQLRRDIDREAIRVLERSRGSRYFVSQLDERTAEELLGKEIEQTTGIRPTRPQLRKALHAIKVAKPGTVHDVGMGIKLLLTPRKYEVTVV